MTALVVRDDLSNRTALSKSVLTAFELCETKSWWQLHDPRPFVPNEKVVFGSAVDAGVEVIVKYLSAGQVPHLLRATEAAAFVIERDDVAVDIVEVSHALAGFAADVAPKFYWPLSVTQSSITAELDGLGECNGHPDIVFGTGTIFDVKTSSRAKEVPSLELGFYALLREAETGIPVPSVGYFNWVRLKRPYWQIAEAPVTDELRRWSYEKAAAYVRARKADTLINAKTAAPQNYSFPGSAKFAALCGDCVYNPALGGPCRVALQAEEAA
jgi:hypothetical protein